MKKVFVIIACLSLLFLVGCSSKTKSKDTEEVEKPKQETKKKKRVLEGKYITCSSTTEEYSEDVDIYYTDITVTNLVIKEKYDSAEDAESVYEIYAALLEDGMECDVDGDTIMFYMDTNYISQLYADLLLDTVKTDLEINGYVCE